MLDELPPHPLPPEGRTHVLVIDRSGVRARRVANHQSVVRTLRQSIDEVGRLVGAPVDRLEVKSWLPAAGANMSTDVGAWRRAALIVAPHGAGLANMLFASHGTPVIEICYDDFGSHTARGMACPAMYAAMAVNLHLPYWVVTGRGGYGTEMHANLTMLAAAATQALQVAYGARHAVGADKKAPHARPSLPRHWKELPACRRR